jgi:hypothetical protein
MEGTLPMSEPAKTTPWRSECCEGETCGLCAAPAAAKVEEVIFADDPVPNRHPLTSYICGRCFRNLMGPRGCDMVEEWRNARAR